jgi:hypothetical protein
MYSLFSKCMMHLYSSPTTFLLLHQDHLNGPFNSSWLMRSDPNKWSSFHSSATSSVWNENLMQRIRFLWCCDLESTSLGCLISQPQWFALNDPLILNFRVPETMDGCNHFGQFNVSSGDVNCGLWSLWKDYIALYDVHRQLDLHLDDAAYLSDLLIGSLTGNKPVSAVLGACIPRVVPALRNSLSTDVQTTGFCSISSSGSSSRTTNDTSTRLNDSDSPSSSKLHSTSILPSRLRVGVVSEYYANSSPGICLEVGIAAYRRIKCIY